MRPLLSTSLLCLLCTFANAQFFPNRVTSTIRTPGGNVPHTYYTGPSFNHFYGGGGEGISSKYRFTIIYKNDSVTTERAYMELVGKSYMLIVKRAGEEEVIKPAETKEIFRIKKDGGRIIGVPTDSCWLFRTRYGPIQEYSFLAEENSEHVIAIQKGTGAVLPLTKENLYAIMEERDEKLEKLIHEGKYLKAIQYYNAQHKKVRK